MSTAPRSKATLTNQLISVNDEVHEELLATLSKEDADGTAWDVEVATIDLTSDQADAASQWGTVARNMLTPDYLETLIEPLRNQSSLPELVTAQLLQHLLKVYGHKIEVVVQEQGIDAIDVNLPHIKVITNRKQGTKRLELVFDQERIKEYLKNSLSEFFTHAGIWKEFAKAVGANLIIWVATDLEQAEKADSSLTEDNLVQLVCQRLHQLDLSLIVERSEVLAQLHCLDIAKKIIDGFNLSSCTLQDMEKLLGLKQRPPARTETSLDFDPIAVLPTSIPIASSIRAQLRPDLWQQGNNQIAVFHYRSKGNPSNYIEHYITNPGDIEMLPWEAAEQIINKFGFDTVKLQLIFAARTMEENEPWNSAFTLKASDIIQLLGWDRNHNTSLSEKRNAVASTAYALSCLLVRSVWIEGRGRRKVDASTPIGRMWDVLIDLHGQFDWVTGKIEKPDEVYITVSPGLWTKHFLNRAGSRAKEALHQFGYLARDILKIDPYHNEMALRLAIQLTLDARIRVRNQNPYDYRVGGLLEEVLAKAEIDRALQDKHKARDLKNRWNNALKLLMSLGWQIEFDPATYPGWLRPGSTEPKPEDWRKIRVIDRLMQAKLTIMPPHPIPTLLAKIKEPKRVKPEPETTLMLELTGEQVKHARESKGWSRKELGGFLNLSADYIGKIERGDRIITPELEPKLRRLLNLA
ncbi:MAG TPA: helix-turn-helix transcriptional regulator [Leptolyngbyaceae cyanobacterium M33_DOE_097]|uniref:XRE family transcriptional regulator n=1 Tax=Oscillatoriales cyanobacterium SpSt-418 TaxID=2282169 RepID=A0A7C3PJ36_9CYAN|nr:helix-turn-helix transcriptional regulator [Leptolyngbyaceae cyanobacterium M33_DOE_097]